MFNVAPASGEVPALNRGRRGGQLSAHLVLDVRAVDRSVHRGQLSNPREEKCQHQHVTARGDGASLSLPA